MKEDIYKNIIKNSKIAYVKINCIKNNDNKYVKVNLIEQSKEFEKLFRQISNNSSFNKKSGKSIIEVWIKGEFTNEEFDNLIRNTINKGHSRIEYLEGFINKKLIIDIYYLEEYFILIYNLEEKNKDIDDKIVLEKHIAQNEENFKEITRYCDSVFIIKNQYRATYVSPAYENIFEADSKEIYKDINKLYEYFKRVEDDNKNIIDNFEIDKPNEGTAKVRLDNNKEKYIWYKFLPIKDETKSVTKRVGILTDITEKQKLEEENNQLKLDFFANLSHELRTPINLISSTIQLIKMNLDKLPKEDAQKLYKYIDIMEVNSFRLIRLINNLLDTSRIDAGFVEFNPVNLDIVSYVEDICDSIIEFVKYNNMDLIFDTNSEEEVVLFDPEMMERILLNILSNAIKFNKANGTIYVMLNVTENDIKISIKDEGIGIPNEKLNKIFKRFEQINSKDKIEKQGSGIGLYLVKTLTELHGGSIEINSEVNKGSEFIISIPRRVLSKGSNKISQKDKISINNNTRVEFSDI